MYRITAKKNDVILERIVLSSATAYEIVHLSQLGYSAIECRYITASERTIQPRDYIHAD